MKKNRLLLAAALTVFIMSWVVAPTVVTAADAWYSPCTVALAGAGAGGYGWYVPIQLTCPDNFAGSKTCTIPTTDSAGANRMLAVVLTAVSMEKQVVVYVPDASAAQPVLNILYIIP